MKTLVLALVLSALTGCSTVPNSTETVVVRLEPCPSTPLRRVDYRATSWQAILDARNAELAEIERKDCRIRY